MKKKIIISTIFFSLFFSFQIKAQSYTTKDLYKSLFAGEYKKCVKILTVLKIKSPNDIKTRLAFADFYFLMYETTGDKEVYNTLCKKEADFVNKTLSKKKELSSDEIFYLISAKAIILKIQFKKKKYLKVAKEFQSISKYLKYATNHEIHPRLKLISGMYNYYIETAKEDYPVAYPVLIFFPSGNKTKGIRLLTESSKVNNMFINTRASLFLANIYKADEKEFKKSEYYFLKLLKNNPGNVHWRKEYIFTLRKYNKTNKASVQRDILLKTIKNNSFLTKDQIEYLKTI